MLWVRKWYNEFNKNGQAGRNSSLRISFQVLSFWDGCGIIKLIVMPNKTMEDGYGNIRDCTEFVI